MITQAKITLLLSTMIFIAFYCRRNFQENFQAGEAIEETIARWTLTQRWVNDSSIFLQLPFCNRVVAEAIVFVL